MDQYLGEIRLCAFAYAPKEWALCDGRLLPIAQNQALFSLLGTQYGGNGTTTFALPDLRGRTPLHRDPNDIVQGQSAGVESVTLTATQLPMHSHLFNVSSSPATALNVGVSQDRVLATSNLYNASNPSISGPGELLYGTPDSLTPLLDEACGNTGGGQPHDNMQPSLVLNYIISLVGIYPSRD
ncbi:tail fiber protein [Cupriavidus necator]|uniref:phage tail protein n=1 Tax=Cupriavidus necator TaxID=106590 RepID=UPI00339D7830